MKLSEKAKAACALLSAASLRSAMAQSDQVARFSRAALARAVEAGMAPRSSKVRGVIWQCDRWLAANYRNEHVYKRSVLDAMSRQQSVLMVPEFRVNKSKADLLVGGDTSLQIIEIKSDLDSLERLAHQINDYRQAVPLISVVGSQRIASKVATDSALDSVGISILKHDGGLESWRSPTFDAECLSSATMMTCLRRAEYLAILKRLGNEVPQMPNTQVFRHALGASRIVDPLVYHSEMVRALSFRLPRAGVKAHATVPRPLRPAIVRLNPNKSELQRLQEWLNSEVGYVSA